MGLATSSQYRCHQTYLFRLNFRTETSKKKPPIYKVMLHNDNYNRREYVVKILLKTIEGLTVDDAVNVMQVCCCTCLYASGARVICVCCE